MFTRVIALMALSLSFACSPEPLPVVEEEVEMVTTPVCATTPELATETFPLCSEATAGDGSGSGSAAETPAATVSVPDVVVVEPELSTKQVTAQ